MSISTFYAKFSGSLGGGGGAGGVTSLNSLIGAVSLVAGSGITVTPSGQNLTIATTGMGSVTSVGLADGSTTPIYTISGSPVTGSGTLTFTLNNKAANLVFAGPSSGSAAQPTFRSLVSADIPSLSYANQQLSNLSSTAVNTDIVPGTNNSFLLGSSSFAWSALFTHSVLGNGTQNLALNGNGAGVSIIGTHFLIQDGSQGTIGNVWQSTQTNGQGQWGALNLASSASVGGVLPIANGGTNNGSLPVTAGGVLYTDGTSIQNVGAGTTGQILQSNGASIPTWVPVPGSSPTSGTQSLSSGQTINSDKGYYKITPDGSLLTEQLLGGFITTGANEPTTWLGQSFQIPSNDNLQTVIVWLRDDNAGIQASAALSGTCVMQIYSDSGGSPSTSIATSTTIFDASTLRPGAGYVPVVFNFAPTALTANTTYYFFLDPTNLTNFQSCTLEMSSYTNVYANGKYWYSTTAGSTFGSVSGIDMQFIILNSPITPTSASTAITAGTVVGQTLEIQDVGTAPMTIKNAATTQLQGNMDVILFPNDTIELIWDGTNWTQTSLSANNH